MRPLASAANAPFRTQLRDWRVKANATRLFVWNYVCDFGNYLQAFPNYNVLGQDIAFFAENTSVTGLFEESCGTGCGSTIRGDLNRQGQGQELTWMNSRVM